MSEEMTPAELAGMTAIITHTAGILAALPMDRYEAAMTARFRAMGEQDLNELGEIGIAREDRVGELMAAAHNAQKFVAATTAAQQYWQKAVRIATEQAGGAPLAFDVEGMPVTGGHVVTLPSGKQVFQLDGDELEEPARCPAVVQAGGTVLYPRFGPPRAVPDGA